MRAKDQLLLLGAALAANFWRARWMFAAEAAPTDEMMVLEKSYFAMRWPKVSR